MTSSKKTTSTTTSSTTEEVPLPKKKGPLGGIVDVTVHPLVLLSAVDHYHRVARNSQRRVVGVLLGTVSRGRVDATNSFAVPFEEDRKNPAVFYLDHNYLENMLGMFRKINAKERVVGFYSTGPQIRPNDLRIFGIVQKFAPPGAMPVFVIVDVRPDRSSLPTTAYVVTETITSSSSSSSSSLGGREEHKTKTFAHIPSTIGAMEAEEVGVEHLLRDINDPTISTVASLIKGKLAGLDTLTEKLVEMKDYLEDVLASDGDKVLHQGICDNMQTILSLLPNLNVEELVQSMLVVTNDFHMVIYLSALIRSVIALHDLVGNKIKYAQVDDAIAEEKKEDETAPITNTNTEESNHKSK